MNAISARQEIEDNMAPPDFDNEVDAMIVSMLEDPSHPAWNWVDAEALDKALRPACAREIKERECV